MVQSNLEAMKEHDMFKVLRWHWFKRLINIYIDRSVSLAGLITGQSRLVLPPHMSNEWTIVDCREDFFTKSTVIMCHHPQLKPVPEGSEIHKALTKTHNNIVEVFVPDFYLLEENTDAKEETNASN